MAASDRTDDLPLILRSWRLGAIATCAILTAVLARLFWSPAWSLPLSISLLLLLVILRERRRSAAREAILIQTHAALAEAEVSFLGIFESSPDLLFVHRIAEDGAIHLERFNPAAGRSRSLDATSYGKCLSELLSPHHYAEAKRAIDHVVATRETLRLQGQPDRDGADAEIVVVPLTTRGEGIDRVFVSIRDIKHAKEAQAAMARSESLYRTLAESTSDLITRISLPDLRRVYVSPASKTLVGYEPDELAARYPLEDIHPDDLVAVNEVLAELSAGSSKVRAPIAYRVRHKDGRWLWVEASTSFTRDATGAIDGLICSIRDVDLRRRAEAGRAASEARFRLLAENASDLIVLGHDDGRRSYISPASMRLVGFTPDELDVEMRGKRWVHPDDIDYLAGVGLVQDDTKTAVSCRVRRKDGSWIWVEAIFCRVPSYADGEPTIIATFRDITERQEQAQALRDAKDAAEAAWQEADQAGKAKSNFLATMSHEIRTPLNAILGFAELLRADDTLRPESRQNLERIRNAGSALRVVVDDILDFSRLEAGELNFSLRPLSLPALIEDAVAIVRGLAQAKQIDLSASIEASAPSFVVGDYNRLRQILINLLNNAIKFTRQGSVTISVAAIADIDSDFSLRISVKDTGIGIARDKLSGIFQRFSQVDGSNSREYGGTGLGLTICQSLVKAMGGTIGVESVVEQGSTFWFDLTLPETAELPGVTTSGHTPTLDAANDSGFDEFLSMIVLEPSDATDAAGSIEPGRRTLDILLVEDVVLNQELVCSILRARRHIVDVLGNGSEAIMAVEDKRYDLVLMDLQMPYVDGLAATRVIRDLAGPHRFVPIVALTAAVLQEQLEAALAAGMNDILTKPISFPDLDAVLAKASRGELRGPLDPEALDPEIVDQLLRVIGDAKVEAMRSLLLKSLAARFTTPLTQATMEKLKAEAHASIAGAAMLGFVRFGTLCRAFIAADWCAAPAAYAALRGELFQVANHLQAAIEDHCHPHDARDVA